MTRCTARPRHLPTTGSRAAHPCPGRSTRPATAARRSRCCSERWEPGIGFIGETRGRPPTVVPKSRTDIGWEHNTRQSSMRTCSRRPNDYKEAAAARGDGSDDGDVGDDGDDGDGGGDGGGDDGRVVRLRRRRQTGFPIPRLWGRNKQDGRKAQTHRHHQRHQVPALVQIRAHHDRRHRGVEFACLCLETCIGHNIGAQVQISIRSAATVVSPG